MIHVKRVSYLALGALLLLSAAGCQRNEEAGTGTDATDYTVARGNLTVDVSASGNLAFASKEDLAFDMAGTVEDVFVDDGDTVAEGQVVATLDTADWENQLRSLRISLLSAQSSLKQARYALDELKSGSRTSITGDVVVRDCCDDEDIELQEMQVEQAEMRLEDAETRLEEHLAQNPEVLAPFDGFVTKVNAEGGDEVMKGSIAVTIADPDRFEVGILVSENDISQIVEGMRATVTVDALSITLPAEVTYVAPTATISSGVVNYEVTIEVATLEDYAAQVRQQTPAMAATLEGVQLRDGLSVTVTLIVAERTNVLLVPNSAINTAGGRAFVTVVKEGSAEERREVTTGVSNWQFTEILAGLTEGEAIRSGATAGGAGLPFAQGGHPGGVVMMPGGGPRG
ncbi:MAG: efflux RND transporter periplasmic adaptor subunit [Dehalococcoidia bacterium]|jgi:RND family efflux transporter MFP subunit|nr:efflux RND transporter periplasmic adaptor subunit [Dehalococcoidia bacterium]